MRQRVHLVGIDIQLPEHRLTVEDRQHNLRPDTLMTPFQIVG